MSWFKRYYNKKSAKKHGWHPSWFAPYLSKFNNELIDEVIYKSLYRDESSLKILESSGINHRLIDS